MDRARKFMPSRQCNKLMRKRLKTDLWKGSPKDARKRERLPREAQETGEEPVDEKDELGTARLVRDMRSMTLVERRQRGLSNLVHVYESLAPCVQAALKIAQKP